MGGGGPGLGQRVVAHEVVREAQGSAESLMAFALEANRWIRDAVQAPRATFALAA